MSPKVDSRSPVELYETYAGILANDEDLEYSTHSYDIQEWTIDSNAGVMRAEIYFMSEFVEQKSDEYKLKPWSEIQRVSSLWENVPLTLSHPDVLPLQFSDDVIGLVKDVVEDEKNHRLKGTAEVPLDPPDWTDMSDTEWDEVLSELETLEEVSIGFWYQQDDSESGTFTNPDGTEVQYNAVIRKPIPDHIAVVRDHEEPVCTPENGCGIETQQDYDQFQDYQILGGHTPPILEDTEWDADSAVFDLRRWAGGPDKDDIDWNEYKWGFVGFDGENADNFGGYMGPHHKVVGGELRTSLHGVMTLANVIEGSMGGFDVPEAVLDEMRDHVQTHANQFDDEVYMTPWERREQTQSEVDRMTEEERSAVSRLASCIETLTKRIYTREQEPEPPEVQESECGDIENDSEEVDETMSEEEEEVEEETEEVEEETTEQEETEDTGNSLEDRVNELEDKVEQYEEELKEKAEKLEEVTGKLKDELITQTVAKTDYDRQDLEDREVSDLENILEVADKVSSPQSEEGEMETQSDNVNSPPSDSNETQVEVIDPYRERLEESE